MFACGCLFALLAGAFPRLALGLLWIFGDLVQKAFDGFLLPFMGLLFLPYTTLFYVLAYEPLTDSVGTWGLFFVVFGFLLDIGSYASQVYTNRDRITQWEQMRPRDTMSAG